MAYRTIIVDRSLLAVNMYRLLLKPLGVQLLITRKYEEARPWFFRREKIDLAVFNSNTFGKKFDEYLRHFTHDEPFVQVQKIFLCKESEDEWQSKLGRLPKSNVLVKPFHPDEFISIVERCLEKMK